VADVSPALAVIVDPHIAMVARPSKTFGREKPLGMFIFLLFWLLGHFSFI
tara:strand:+ start:234 stop:383 length:150 start_codon:yes stop_codon:yes gene_type:complete